MSRSSSLLSTHVHVIFVHLPVNMFVAATQHAFQHPCLRVYDFVGLFTTSSTSARSCTRFVRIASAFVSHLQACNDPSSRRNGGAKSRWKKWLVSPIRGRGEGETTRSEFEIFWTRPFLLQAVGSRVKPDGINRI